MDDYSGNEVLLSDDEFYDDDELVDELSISSEDEIDDDKIDDLSITNNGDNISVMDDISDTSGVGGEVLSKQKQLLKNYALKRLGLFELVGILSQRYNQLEKGSTPLFELDLDYYENNSTWDALVDEVLYGKCPIVIQKDGYFLKLTDYPSGQVLYRLENIVNLWNIQNKKVKTWDEFKLKHGLP